MKVIFTVLGIIFTGLGVIGAFLPILPTVPFLILALICFSKGSERFYQWFVSTKLYKRHLEEFHKSYTMSLKSKVVLLFFTTFILLAGIYHSSYIWLKIFLICLLLIKYYFFIFKIKTLR